MRYTQYPTFSLRVYVRFSMILHVDMDAFFASVEERDNPRLKGQPLVVGGNPRFRGVVASANYPARALGIHSAMPMASAFRQCPDVIIVPPRGNLYRQVSGQIHAIFQRYTPLVEPLSLDEAFLDVRASQRLFGSTETIARRIKQEIQEELGLVASLGVGPNKFLAKLASDHEKPDGFTIISPDEVQAFLDPLPVERIWGVGKVARSQLLAKGVRTVHDLRQTSPEWLKSRLGQSGLKLWKLCHGVDHRPVVTDSETRSISHETTFHTDIHDLAALESVALSLTEGVCYRMRSARLKARCVRLKVRFHDFPTITRSHRFPVGTSGTLDIWQQVHHLLKHLLARKRFCVRLIGVGVSHFTAMPWSSHSNQADLFAIEQQPGNTSLVVGKRQEILDQLTDEVRHRFGKNLLRRGRGL